MAILRPESGHCGLAGVETSPSAGKRQVSMGLLMSLNEEDVTLIIVCHQRGHLQRLAVPSLDHGQSWEGTSQSCGVISGRTKSEGGGDEEGDGRRGGTFLVLRL